jgi:hypothetical protein
MKASKRGPWAVTDKDTGKEIRWHTSKREIQKWAKCMNVSVGRERYVAAPEKTTPPEAEQPPRASGTER